MQFSPGVCSSYPEFLQQLESAAFADRRQDISREPIAEFLQNNITFIEANQQDAQLQADLTALVERVDAVSSIISQYLPQQPQAFDLYAAMGISPYPTQNWQSLSQSEKVAYINENATPIANLVDYKTADAATQFLVQNPGITFLDLRGYDITDQQLVQILQNRASLEALYCSSSQLTGNGVDFSHCTQLEQLMLQCPNLSVLPSLASCPILALDLSTCSMSQVDINTLTQLKGVDCKGCPNLVKITLPCGSSLKVVDVGGSSQLSELQNLSSLTGLEGLGLDNCLLMNKLDLSQLTTLQILHIGGIQFEEFAGLDKLVHLQELNREGSNLEALTLQLQTRARIV